MEPKRLLPSFGIIYGGLVWQSSPWPGTISNYELIDVYDLSKRRVLKKTLNLGKYDVLIVPWAPDQIFLQANAEQIEYFLRSGGVVVAFGEFDLRWLPQITWRFDIFDEIKIANGKEGHPIFRGLKSEDLCNWHDSAHGYFSGFPQEAEVLLYGIQDGDERVIAYVDTETYAGAVIAMTIDPDFHTYQGLAAARQLLRNTLSYAIELAEAIEQKGARKHHTRTVDKLTSFAITYLPEIAGSIAVAVIAGLITAAILFFLLPN